MHFQVKPELPPQPGTSLPPLIKPVLPPENAASSSSSNINLLADQSFRKREEANLRLNGEISSACKRFSDALTLNSDPKAKLAGETLERLSKELSEGLKTQDTECRERCKRLLGKINDSFLGLFNHPDLAIQEKVAQFAPSIVKGLIASRSMLWAKSSFRQSDDFLYRELKELSERSERTLDSKALLEAFNYLMTYRLSQVEMAARSPLTNDINVKNGIQQIFSTNNRKIDEFPAEVVLKVLSEKGLANKAVEIFCREVVQEMLNQPQYKESTRTRTFGFLALRLPPDNLPKLDDVFSKITTKERSLIADSVIQAFYLEPYTVARAEELKQAALRATLYIPEELKTSANRIILGDKFLGRDSLPLTPDAAKAIELLKLNVFNKDIAQAIAITVRNNFDSIAGRALNPP